MKRVYLVLCLLVVSVFVLCNAGTVIYEELFD